MDKLNPVIVLSRRHSFLKHRLIALTSGRCTGSDEYADCAIASLESQAMAKALIEIIFESSDVEGLDREIEDRLYNALKKALRVKPGDFGEEPLSNQKEDIKEEMRAGEFTTERGCIIKVIPPGLYNPERTTLAFSMLHPEDIRTGEVLLTEEELEKLRRILNE